MKGRLFGARLRIKLLGRAAKLHHPAYTQAGGPTTFSQFLSEGARACISAFVGGNGIRIPILRTRSPYCARAASGHAAAPPRSVMKSDVSFDQLVGAQEERLRNRQADLLGGLEIDHQHEFGRLLDGEIGGLGALQDPIDVGGASP